MKLSVITPCHDPSWLAQTWQSLTTQTHSNWEWVVLANGPRLQDVALLIKAFADERIVLRTYEHVGASVGDVKRRAFELGTGEALIELDHDDLLTPTALAEIDTAFADPDVGFVFSDFADFDDRVSEGQGSPPYCSTIRQGWLANGFEFYMADMDGVRPGRYECVRSFVPSALSLSLIFWAPNHVRAWRKELYERLGGHNAKYEVCDDHELMIRTYLATKMSHIPKPIYLYRHTGRNTVRQREQLIQTTTFTLREQYLEQLVLRECALRGLPAYDLGGGIDPRPGWTPVDLESDTPAPPGFVQADLSKDPWPFETNSVGAFRAADLLEHLPDKHATMRRIHRCLRPGGWLLSMTPSTEGRGAFMAPDHVSYWNEQTFWYYTQAQFARYLRNKTVRFQSMGLETFYPSPFHQQHHIPYVRANLVALKDDYRGPGERLI